MNSNFLKDQKEAEFRNVKNYLADCRAGTTSLNETKNLFWKLKKGGGELSAKSCFMRDFILLNTLIAPKRLLKKLKPKNKALRTGF